MVDDNFHYSDEDERYEAGVFDRYQDAVEKCREIVEACLREQFKPSMSADELYRAYARCCFSISFPELRIPRVEPR